MNITPTKRIIELETEVAMLRANLEASANQLGQLGVVLSRERARLAYVVEAVRAIEANAWSADRVHEIAVRVLREIGQP